MGVRAGVSGARMLSRVSGARVLVACLLGIGLARGDVTYEENVAVLDPANFDDCIKAQPYTIVEFYAVRMRGSNPAAAEILTRGGSVQEYNGQHPHSSVASGRSP